MFYFLEKSLAVEKHLKLYISWKHEICEIKKYFERKNCKVLEIGNGTQSCQFSKESQSCTMRKFLIQQSIGNQKWNYFEKKI